MLRFLLFVLCGRVVKLRFVVLHKFFDPSCPLVVAPVFFGVFFGEDGFVVVVEDNALVPVGAGGGDALSEERDGSLPLLVVVHHLEVTVVPNLEPDVVLTVFEVVAARAVTKILTRDLNAFVVPFAFDQEGEAANVILITVFIFFDLDVFL